MNRRAKVTKNNYIAGVRNVFGLTVDNKIGSNFMSELVKSSK